MGILIRLNLLGNNEELNVKILNDDCSTNFDDSTSNILANFNVTINKQNNENNADIVVESCGRSNLLQDIHAANVQKQSNSCRNDDEDEEVTLEEYFVVDEVVGNRYNPITKQPEFLLKLKNCVPVDNEWTCVNTRKSQLPEEGRLYVQKSQNLLSLKERAHRRHESSSYEGVPTWKEKSRQPIVVDLGIEEELPENSGLRIQNVKQAHADYFTENDVNVRDNTEKSTSYPHIASGSPTSSAESNYSTFFADTENISIKCEPAIDDIEEHEEYDGYESVDLMNFGRHPLANGSLDNSCPEFEENVKPVVDEESSSRSRFTCDLCGRSFSAIHYLKMHAKIHTKTTIYTCSICSHAFGNAYLLSLHERDVHSIRPRRRRRIFTSQKRQPQEATPVPLMKPKPFKCPLCTRSFADKQSLRLHEAVHNDGRLFQCGSCDRVFTYLHALKNHVKVHSNVKSLPCAFCGKLFAMVARLKLHERKHRNEMLPPASLRRKHKLPATSVAASSSAKTIIEGKAFVCPVCPKAFRLKNTLHIHMRQHTGEKPYYCTLCDYRSAQKISLSCHMRKHEAHARLWRPATGDK